MAKNKNGTSSVNNLYVIGDIKYKNSIKKNG
jgi:hypothetical protein